MALRASRRALREIARRALDDHDDRSALAALLELDDRFRPEPWVLASLASLFRDLDQPERALKYLRRALDLDADDDTRALMPEIERELEVMYRDRARSANIQGRPGEAVDIALVAAQVAEPATWTIRVLVDAAVASNRRDDAREHVARARRLRPADAPLAELERKLDA